MNRRDRKPAAGLAVVLVVLLAACGVVTAFAQTDSALHAAGFTEVSTSVRSVSGDLTEVVVRARTSGSGGTPPLAGALPQGSAESAAQQVWESFPYRIDLVEVSVSSGAPVVFDRAQLESMFGPRPAGYDTQTVSAAAVSSGTGVVVGVFASILVLLFVVVAVSRTSRRSRAWRSRRDAPGGWDLTSAWPHHSAGGGEVDVELPPGQWPPPIPPEQPPDWGRSGSD